MKRWFITGTDTDAGKTVATCALLRHLAKQGRRAVGLKPVASGCDVTPDGLRNADALDLMAASALKLPYEQVNPYAFAPPIAPHLAAAEAGVEIDPEHAARNVAGVAVDWLLIEGVGGWSVPLGPDRWIRDLARAFTEDVVLVVGLRLGCLNHAMLTAAQVERDGFRLRGWIACEVDPGMQRGPENLLALEERLPAARLGTIPWSREGGGRVHPEWTSALEP